LFRVIQNVHQILFKEKDRSRLLQGICDHLIKDHVYYNGIWIALLDESGGLITTVEAGWGKKFLPIIQMLKSGKLPDCAQMALMQSEVVLTEDTLSLCKDCPLSTKYHGSGAMTVRLEHDGRVYGILSVSVSKEFMPEEKEHGLLKEVAGDVAFALHSMELEEDRRRIEEALQESEKRFRNLVEHSPTGITIIQDDQIVYKNPEQERLFGPSPHSFKFTDFKNIHPDDLEKIRKNYMSIISGEVSVLQMDFRFYPEDKIDSRVDMKWVYCRASRIEYQGKEAILLNMMDITRAKELEHLLRIQDKMTSLGRIAIGIAHEIRNPLSGINIYLSTLEKIYEKGGNQEKVKNILDHLQSASGKIESVIKRVMDFSKPCEPKFILTDIRRPIDEAISLSEVTLRKSGIKIEKALAEGVPLCRIDPNLMTEVILNLVINAAEAMKDMEGRKIIEIATSMDDQSVLVSIMDSGPGVPSNHKDRIFDPFYTTKHGSTGIGLNICRRIITDHGGSLDILTSKWGGAEFVIQIPLEKGIAQR